MSKQATLDKLLEVEHALGLVSVISDWGERVLCDVSIQGIYKGLR